MEHSPPHYSATSECNGWLSTKFTINPLVGIGFFMCMVGGFWLAPSYGGVAVAGICLAITGLALDVRRRLRKQHAPTPETHVNGTTIAALAFVCGV